MVFAGMDAAGKGSTVRRITAAFDARLYRIAPVAAPIARRRSSRLGTWWPPTTALGLRVLERAL